MSNGMTVRLAGLCDWPIIRYLHEEQNDIQGTRTVLPRLFTQRGELAANIAMAFMVEIEGKPASSFYFEIVPEVCFAGCMNPKATAYARREVDRIAFGLRHMGYTGVNCKVPGSMAEQIERPLNQAGFYRDDWLVHYFKDLRLPLSAGEEGKR